MQHGRVEGLMLGSVLAALGDGLVIPKMQAAEGIGTRHSQDPTYEPNLDLQLKTNKYTPPKNTGLISCNWKNCQFGKERCLRVLISISNQPLVGLWFRFSNNSLPKEFAQSFPKHELPRLVSSWAPVEASFVLTTFGVLAGLASPESGTSSIQGSLEMGWGCGSKRLRLRFIFMTGFWRWLLSIWRLGVKFGSISSILVTLTKLREYHGKNSSTGCWCLSYKLIMFFPYASQF